MKKKIFLVPLALLLAVSLLAIGCPAPAPAPAPAAPEVAELQEEITTLKADLAEARAKVGVEPEYSWRFGLTPPAGSTYALGAEMLASLIHEYSDGRIEITVYPGGTLGSMMEIIEAVQAGDLDMGYTFPYGSVNPKFDVAQMPFLQSNNEQMKHLHLEAYDGIVYRIVSSTFEEIGLKYLTISFFAVTSFFTNRGPIRTPADFKGLKIRVYGDMLMEAVARMGGLPTPISRGEIYSSLHTGVIDGAVGHARYSMDIKAYEVAKYVDDINLYGCGGANTMNLELYNALPGDLKEAIARAASDTELWLISQEAVNMWKAERDIVKYGVTVTHLTDEERQAFIDLVKPEELWREYLTDALGPDLLEEVITEAARIRALY